MEDRRQFLPAGTRVEFEGSAVYRITGEPIGCGGGSVLYPAEKVFRQNEALSEEIRYVLKECYPASGHHSYTRSQTGQILPQDGSGEAEQYLQRAQEMQIREKNVSQAIFRTANRMLPIRGSARRVVLTLPDGHHTVVDNTMTVMDSLTEKGCSLAGWIQNRRRFTTAEALRILQQLLFALREVHRAGYLHLDIQDGNVFLRGNLEDLDELVTLIDFGCARKLAGEKTEPIRDKVIFTTQGFSAPEILLRNDGNLRLGPEADLYSAGCVLLYLLTGQRPNVNQLMVNRTGMILKPNQLRRILCPKHLVDTLQHLLARALATEPENRYGSAEEMLADVNALLKALEPYRTNLSAVKYDAFVCYRHGPVDSAAALTLQRALEDYRVPWGTGIRRKPFGRVFVDEGELSSCADFGLQIREALRNSAWLIVICSPDTPLSPWVRQEIDIFLEEHQQDRSRILAVLTGGTPETAFPPQLRGDETGKGEVFAAHALSKTPQEAEKRLKGDALLKIAAPMLETTYDTLKQRQKVYRLQKLAATAAVVLLSAGGFGVYAANRARVIAQQEARIQEEHRVALEQEALVLIEQAEKKMEDNDPQGAARLLLPILTNPEQSPSVAAEAEYLLGKTLGIYETPLTGLYAAAPTGIADTDCRKFFLDGEEEFLFAWDGQQGNVKVWDARTMQPETEIFPGEQVVYTDKTLLMPESRALLIQTDSGVVCADFESGETLWNYTGENVRNICLAGENRQVMVLAGDFRSEEVRLDILDSQTGALLRQQSFRLREGHYLSFFEEVRVSADGTWMAFTAEGEQPEEEGAYGDTLYLLEPETGRCRLLIESGTAIRKIEMIENKLAVMRWSGVSSGLGTSTCTMRLETYDCATGKQNWSFTETFYPGTAGGDLIKRIPGEATGSQRDRILFAFADRCLLADWQTGECLQRYEMTAPIADVSCYTDGFRVLGDDGSYTLASYDTDSLRTLQLINGTVTAACCGGRDFYVQSSPEDRRIRKFTWGHYDEAYVSVYEAENAEWYLGETYKNEGRYSAIRLEQYDRIRFVDLTTGSVRDYEIPEAYGFAGGWSPDGETVYWSSGDWEDPFYSLDLETEEIRELPKPEGLGEWSYVREMLFRNHQILFVEEQYGKSGKEISICCWDLQTNTLRREYTAAFDQFESVASRSFRRSRTEDLVAFVVENRDSLPAVFVCLNRTTGEVTRVDLTFLPEAPEYAFQERVVYDWNDSGDRLIFGFGSQSYLVDKDGKLLYSISAEDTIATAMFSPDGKYIYLFEEEGRILKCDAADGSCTDELSLRDYCTADGFLRGNLILWADRVQWTFIGESELLIYDWSNGGFLLEGAGEEIRMKAVLPKCCGYDPELDQFLVSDSYYLSGELSSLGVFHRYSQEDLIQKAQKILQP